jgi:hypothetical protein
MEKVPTYADWAKSKMARAKVTSNKWVDAMIING